MFEAFRNNEEAEQTDRCRLFPCPLIQEKTLYALVTDMFDWFEKEWRLPVVCAELVRGALPSPVVLTKGSYTVAELRRLYGVANVGRVLHRYHIVATGSTFNKGRRAALYCTEDLAPLIECLSGGLEYAPVLTKEAYCTEELMCLFGVKHHSRVNKLVRKYGIVPIGDRWSQGSPVPLYRKEDLEPAIVQWEGDRLVATLNQWWLRFFPPACQMCMRCQKHAQNPLIQHLMCKGTSLNPLRSVVVSFLRDVGRLGSVRAWWREHQVDAWEREPHAAWGIVFIYLLDRRFIELSIDELLRMKPLYSMDNQERTRLWQHRRPQEYSQFLAALQATNYNASMQVLTLKVLSLLVLLRYGLAGLVELGRALSSNELQQVCREQRLVTPHLGHGMFLPYPHSKDIRVGHVILDEIRYYMWEYAVHQVPVREVNQRDRGPRHWNQGLVSAIEQALAAPMYGDGERILSRRPEIERSLMNPWRIHQRGIRIGTSYILQPSIVQDQLMTYITYCYREQGIALSTLRSRVMALMHLFTWVRAQGALIEYPHWSRETTHSIFRGYASTECAEMTISSQSEQLRLLASFFSTLAGLECVVPVGYQVLFMLAKGKTWEPRILPHEEVFDCVFHEGVCQLSYDPFARLALTIQYYCGTRVTETCELHLFCLLEDQQGHAYVLIPRGKTKQERPFPIAKIGMERLLEYMDQIISLRLSSEGTSRTLGKTNFRYLNDDPGRANDWHYLFDRVPVTDGGRKKVRGKLSAGRVQEALYEALILAAKNNPEELFQMETYSPICLQRRSKGMECRYFASREGITTCPRCGARLSGHQGGSCHHILEEDFVCNGIAQAGEMFCLKCEAPLAKFVPMTTHLFRHNSVSRAHHAGVSVSQNMRLHGHQTIPMHLRYLHLYLEETAQEVRQLFAEKRLREVSLTLASSVGKIVEEGRAYTISLEQYLGVTLRRTLKRRTSGIWGGFWAGALARGGIGSPLSLEEEIVILEESYEHAVAQYWYEALGLAVSEVAFESVMAGKWRAQVPGFLDRQKIDALVQFHLRIVQDSLGSPLGRKLIETDIVEQRCFLHELSEKLRPWWQPLGTIDRLVEMFLPGGGNAFQKPIPDSEAVSGAIDTLS